MLNWKYYFNKNIYIWYTINDYKDKALKYLWYYLYMNTLILLDIIRIQYTKFKNIYKNLYVKKYISNSESYK